MNTDTHHTQWVTWVVIICVLTLGAGAYWFVTKEFTGRAAETVNVAHTEALTGSSLGLVGYWTLDGSDIKWSDSTTEIKDTSGNSKHGDAQGSLAAGSATPGQVGQGLRFNGTSDVISLGTVYNGVKTIAFWAKPNSTTQPFIDLNGTATIDVTSGTVAANSFTSPTIYVDGAVTSTFPDTNWHHIVITTGTGINASATNIGKISTSYFGGTLDDIRFYSSALSSTQVTDLYRASSAKEVGDAAHRDVLTNGLVGYWTFDGRDIKWSDTGTEVKDISGNGNHGDASGLTTTSVTPGKLGQALSFNGTSDWIDIGAISSNFYAISFWINVPTSITNSTACEQAFTYGDAVFGSNDQESILLGNCSNYATDETLMIMGYNPVGPSLFRTYIKDTITVGWHHIVLSWSSTLSRYEIFIDSSSKIVYAGDVSGNTPLTTIDDFEIANGGDSAGYSYFAGFFDDIRIYNRGLSTTEIANLYNIGR